MDFSRKPPPSGAGERMKKRKGARAETTRTAARRVGTVKVKRSAPTPKRKPRGRVAARAVTLPRTTSRWAVSVRSAPAISNRGLYPAIEPYRHGFLRVSELHEIYYEEASYAAGRVGVFLHGAGGAGSAG